MRCLEVAKIVALGSVSLLALGGVLVEFQSSSAIKHVDEDLAQTTASLNQAIGQVKGTTDNMNALIRDARGSVAELNHNAVAERKYLDTQLPQLISDTHAILFNLQTATADLHPLLNESTARVHDLEPIEAGATHLTVDADRTFADPHIAEFVANLDATTAQLATASKAGAAPMQHVEAITADAQQEVHKFTHPKPMVTIADWTLKVVHALGGWF